MPTFTPSTVGSPPPANFGAFLLQGLGTQLLYRSSDGAYLTLVGASLAAVYLDNLENSGGEHHITQGHTFHRIATITGLNQAYTDSSPGLYCDALVALTAIVGDRGT